MKLTWKSPKLETRVITLAAFLIALNLSLGKVSIGSPNLVKFGFGFLGTTLIGYFLGPWVGGIAMVIGDIVGNTLLNTGSSFFIGFTFSAFISGVIAGAFLYKQNITWQRIAVYEFIQLLVNNVFFTTLWIHLLYQAPIMPLLAVRIPKEIIMYPIQIVLGLMIIRIVERLPLRNIGN
ncbi:folate family ECF transporter S component [Enterococcus faecium]|uniref:folate family ECF transporter S component n=1 Tax=Enterococcus faecium TaxID=1352 RepID=UPI0034A4C8AA